MIVIKSNDATALSFEMDIEGAATRVEKVSLVLETKDFDIRFPADYANRTVTSNIPVLEHILESGEYEMALEVNIDGKVYTPLRESVLIETPIQVKAKLSESVEIKEEVKEEPVFKTTSLSKAILSEAKSQKV